MTQASITYPIIEDTIQTAALRKTAHGLGTAPCIALLLFAAGLALETLPPTPQQMATRSALELAARVPAGQSVDPDQIADAMQNEDGEGPVYFQQLAPPGPQADAWAAISAALGYAAWHECVRRDEHPSPLIEGFATPDALDFAIDPFVGIPDLDWHLLERATVWLQRHASKAKEGWGKPLHVDDLRRAAANTSYP